MNVYLFEHNNRLDVTLLEEMLDCHIQTYKIESGPLLENSVFIVEPNSIQYLLQSRPDIVNIKNKRLLIIHEYKSMSFLHEVQALEYVEIFEKLSFENKNIYFITQL